MIEEKTKIGPALLFVLLFSVLSGYGVMPAPFIAARSIGHNGYWGVLLAGLLSLPVLWTASYLGNRYAGLSIVQILNTKWGRFIGSLFSAAYLLFLLVLALGILQDMANLTGLYFLPRTPVMAVALVIMVPVWYMAWKGIEAFTRTAAFVFPFAVLMVLFALLSSYQNVTWENLLPVFDRPMRILTGTPPLFLGFLPSVALFSVMKYLGRPKETWRTVVWATVPPVVLIFFGVISAIGTFGQKTAGTFYLPMLEVTRQSNIPSLLQTVGLIFFPAIVVFAMISLSLLIWAVSDGMSELTRRSSYKEWSVVATVILFVGAMFLRTEPLGIQFFEAISRFGIWFVYVFLAMVWLSLIIGGKAGPKHAL